MRCRDVLPPDRTVNSVFVVVVQDFGDCAVGKFFDGVYRGPVIEKVFYSGDGVACKDVACENIFAWISEIDDVVTDNSTKAPLGVAILVVVKQVAYVVRVDDVAGPGVVIVAACCNAEECAYNRAWIL